MTKILIVNPNTTASMTATIAAAAREVAASGTEIVASDVIDGTGLDRGLLRRGLCGAGADPGLVECARRRRRDHRLFRRHRPRRGADCRAVSGRRHLRGGAGDGGPDRKTHRRSSPRCRARSCRWKSWCAATALRSGRGSPHAMSRCSIWKSRAPARARSWKPKSRWRWTRARKRSCWAAPAWPISRTRFRKKYGVPVVDGVAAAVKQAEALAGLKLTTSRRGSYAAPAAKNYSGLLAPFAPKN